MKRTLAVFGLLAFFVTLPAMGQQKPFDFAIQGGVNLANLEYDPDIEPGTETLLCFGGGAVLSMNLSPGVSLDIDGLYMQKGAKIEFEENFGPQGSTGERVWTNLELQMAYILLVPKLRFQMQSGGVSPYFLAGPEIGFLMSAKEKGTVDPEWGDVEDIDEDVKDHYENVTYGLNFGGGLSFPTGSSSVYFEARYVMGLSNIRKENPDTEGEEPTIKHSRMYVMGGIRF